jgi:hypothetical protein
MREATSNSPPEIDRAELIYDMFNKISNSEITTKKN